MKKTMVSSIDNTVNSFVKTRDSSAAACSKEGLSVKAPSTYTGGA